MSSTFFRQSKEQITITIYYPFNLHLENTELQNPFMKLVTRYSVEIQEFYVKSNLALAIFRVYEQPFGPFSRFFDLEFVQFLSLKSTKIKIQNL